MQLYNYRNRIIRLFKNKNIRLSVYAYNAKSEPKEYDGVEKSEQKLDENTGKTVKLRRQKSDGLYKMITEKDEIINRVFSKNIFNFRVYLICKKN